jgi:DNA gyrase subunit B
MAYAGEPEGGEYSADSIPVLDGVEAIRRRPGMYVGDTGLAGLSLLISDLLDSPLDEFRTGFGKRVRVSLLEDGGYRISDEGRALSVEADAQSGRPLLELALTQLMIPGTGSAHQRVYLAPGMHGIGLCTVNALSERFCVETRRDGKLWRQGCSRGELLGPLQVVGNAETTGVTITFWPDPLLFTQERVIPPDWLEHRLRELAFLHSGLTLDLVNDRDVPARVVSFHAADGLADFVRYLNRDRAPAHPNVIHCRAAEDGMQAEAALQWTTDEEEHFRSYANAFFTAIGGTHLTGFRHAVGRCVGDYLRRRGLVPDIQAAPVGEGYRTGLTAVVAVSLQEPVFSGATRGTLHNPEVEGLVRHCVWTGLTEFIQNHPQDAGAIAARVLASRPR